MRCLCAALILVAGLAAAPDVSAAPTSSHRSEYHFTVPDNWKNDPQRPFYLNGKYHYLYLYNRDYLRGPGTEWRLATTTDNVTFTDQEVAIPKYSQPNGDLWSGSPVVDHDNTAGFGTDAVIALVTQPDLGADDRGAQAQFLWYSTDGGRSFQSYSDRPVLPNPGRVDFRDPKVVRAGDQWVMALAEGSAVGFYVSADLKDWRPAGRFDPGMGTLECPDLFQIAADDGTVKWVLGVSVAGRTYAYWTGAFTGATFQPDAGGPQWLDHGWDWYGAVTWEKHGSADTRFALAWMNKWDYWNVTPTWESDGFNGTDSIVREIRLRRQPGGAYSLVSQPVGTLDGYVSDVTRLGTLAVTGHHVLDVAGAAYEIQADISWDQLSNVGFQLRRSSDGSRHADVGVYLPGGFAYANRGYTGGPSATLRESRTPFDTGRKSVHLRILVDRTTLEVFVDDGKYVHSSLIFPDPEDTGIALYATDGTATFANLTVRRFRPIAPGTGTLTGDFEGGDYRGWSASGTAFGTAPAAGTLPGQQRVNGYRGKGLVNSFLGGDAGTGTLTSPAFTIEKPYLNFLIGGGDHPGTSSEATVFADFEGSTWGDGWTATGSFANAGPTAGNLPGQLGGKALDTCVDTCDPATGTITSPEFTINRRYINFLVSMGSQPSINLVVDGQVVRTASGRDRPELEWRFWDVGSLMGKKARIQIVDQATGAWGHLAVDQIVFSGPGAETTVNLLVDGRHVRTATGRNARHLRPASWDVSALIGKRARIQIVDTHTGVWGHITADQFEPSDTP
jgi:levanbiose-producing levanase